jgi:hypothetical protein
MGIINGVDHLSRKKSNASMWSCCNFSSPRHRSRHSTAWLRRRWQTYRVNSDAVAVAIAEALKALKVIFIPRTMG